jgi:hypothetical protein
LVFLLDASHGMRAAVSIFLMNRRRLSIGMPVGQVAMTMARLGAFIIIMSLNARVLRVLDRRKGPMAQDPGTQAPAQALGSRNQAQGLEAFGCR